MHEPQIFRNQYLTVDHSQFAPVADLTDKCNFIKHVFIERDGSLSEVVRLNVLNDRDREDIIGFHFAQQYAKVHFLEQDEQPHFYIVGRDDPWDFEYVMHDGTTFTLEICRIGDKELLKAIKIENDVKTLLLKSELKGFEIQKIEKHFPGTLPANLVEISKSKANQNRRFVGVGLDSGPKLFLRPPMNPQELDLRTEIETALKKKAAKKHAGKDRTIVVLDNLTTHFTPAQFIAAIEQLGDFLDQLPFRSVWLYTGYYSDDDGRNCEYSMIPIKLSEEESRFLTKQSNN